MVQKLREQMNSFFVGKEGIVEDMLVCLLAGGHVLLEDARGLEKQHCLVCWQSL